MKIVVLSDTHLIDEESVFDANIDAIGEYVGQRGAESLFCLGDMTCRGTTYAEQLQYAHAKLCGFAEKVGAPIHFIPGNHDVGDNAEFLSSESADGFTSERLTRYRQYFGREYWAQRIGNWLLVGLNALAIGTGSESEAEQLKWLKGELSKHTGPIGLMLHKPLLRNSYADEDFGVRYIKPEARRELLKIFEGHNLRFVLSGHVHQERDVLVEGIHHIWVASTSFCMPDAMQHREGERQVGILEMDLREDGGFGFDRPAIPGLVRHNILHYPHFYPSLAGMREKLGDKAEI